MAKPGSKSTKPAMKVTGNEIVTTVLVKNMEAAPIAGFQIDEYWYDSNGTPMGATTYRHPKPLQAGEVITVTLKTPRTAAHEPQQGRSSFTRTARSSRRSFRSSMRRRRKRTTDYGLQTTDRRSMPDPSSLVANPFAALTAVAGPAGAHERLLGAGPRHEQPPRARRRSHPRGDAPAGGAETRDEGVREPRAAANPPGGAIASAAARTSGNLRGAGRVRQRRAAHGRRIRARGLPPAG